MKNFEEARAFVREHLGGAFETVKAKYQEERSVEEDLRKAANDACETFFTDVNQRRERVRAQIRSLDQRKVDIAADKAQLHGKLMKAIADGSSDVAEIRQRLTLLEAELMAIPGQIEALRNQNIPGDETLYRAAQEAYARWGEHRDKDILDGFKGTASEIFDQIGILFELGENGTMHGNGLAFVPGPNYQLQKEVEKMEDMFSGKLATSIIEEDRRNGGFNPLEKVL